MAEWLRRLTRNQFPSGSVGSNPTDCGIFFPSQVARSALVRVPNKCCLLCQVSIVGSVVECSPATRAARVRFPDDAHNFLPNMSSQKIQKFGGAGYRSRYLSHAKRALYHLSYAPSGRGRTLISQGNHDGGRSIKPS